MAKRPSASCWGRGTKKAVISSMRTAGMICAHCRAQDDCKMEQHNPFSPPKADVTDAVPPPTDDEIASRTRRFFNMLIDVAGQLVLMLVLLVIAFIVYPPLAESSFLEDEGV